MIVSSRRKYASSISDLFRKIEETEAVTAWLSLAIHAKKPPDSGSFSAGVGRLRGGRLKTRFFPPCIPPEAAVRYTVTVKAPAWPIAAEENFPVSKEDMMRTLVSYLMKPNDPVWPGNPPLTLRVAESIDRGDVANTFNIELHNHRGTHMDAPWHFNNKGKKIAELPFDSFFYERPLMLDIPKKSREMITAGDLKPYHDRIAGCDLLMVRTGYGPTRFSDPKAYAEDGPGFGSDAAKYLMDNFPHLKALALDIISLASYRNSEDGGISHRTMLGAYHARPGILIIEDVRMAGLPTELTAAAAIPLFIEGIDSSPVTMWVEHE
jgi:kynurenine formamidase